MSKEQKIEDEIFSKEDFPKMYLTSPIVDAFRPELEKLYQKKRSNKNFEGKSMNFFTQKFMRLYFYQGLDQPDRLLVHTELLEFKNKQFHTVAASVSAVIITYITLGTTVRYSRFSALRWAASLGVGYLVWRSFKTHALNKIEKGTGHLYEKYSIK
ncbi:unnamed protein product [Blepharisma stoltei]|uniref:Transmembrane protein n=1 Tax=Blepharisma stoltei TaxID=1481888 RepID=A0AAU9K7W0_9CILI|nr:unnamed protein product [Blepharisma stoltei]